MTNSKVLVRDYAPYEFAGKFSEDKSSCIFEGCGSGSKIRSTINLEFSLGVAICAVAVLGPAVLFVWNIVDSGIFGSELVNRKMWISILALAIVGLAIGTKAKLSMHSRARAWRAKFDMDQSVADVWIQTPGRSGKWTRVASKKPFSVAIRPAACVFSLSRPGMRWSGYAAVAWIGEYAVVLAAGSSDESLHAQIGAIGFSGGVDYAPNATFLSLPI